MEDIQFVSIYLITSIYLVECISTQMGEKKKYMSHVSYSVVRSLMYATI